MALYKKLGGAFIALGLAIPVARADVTHYDFTLEVLGAFYSGADAQTQAFVPAVGELASGQLAFDTAAPENPAGPGVAMYPQDGFDASLTLSFGSGLTWESTAQAVSIMMIDSEAPSPMPDGFRVIGDSQSLINDASLQVDHIWITNAYPSDTFDSTALPSDMPEPLPDSSAVSLRAIDDAGAEFRVIGRLARFERIEENFDADFDGVGNDTDACPDTPEGAVVDAQGCSVSQYCECDGFRNHGAYVSCISHSAKTFRLEGLITKSEKRALVSTAAASSCSVKRPR